jgi:cobalt/nickel transport system permease protein
LHHVVVERWSRRASPLHARDARAKLAALLIFLIAVSTTRSGSHVAFAAYGAVLAAGILWARLPIPSLARRAALVLPFSLAFALITWWSGDGQRAIALIEKSFLSALAVLLVIASTPLAEMLRGLESAGVPRVLVLVIQFLYRYLFVISEQAQHMRMAARSRNGFRFHSAAGALGVLFAKSSERAEGVYRAMLARGFSGTFPLLAPPRFVAADTAFLLSAAAISAGVRFAL